jgi:hypothetical protein
MNAMTLAKAAMKENYKDDDNTFYKEDTSSK